MLNGEERINKILNKYLEKFDLTATLDTEFAYYYSKNIVTYSFFVLEKYDTMFKKVCDKIAKSNMNADIFLLSLFHEIGHAETIEDLSDEEIYSSTVVKEKVSEGAIDEKEYFYAPDEYIATQWGVKYIQEHDKEIADLWAELQPAILQFYEDNDIER